MVDRLVPLEGSGTASRAGTTAGMTIAAAVAMLALPSAVLGFGTRFQTGLNTGSAGRDGASPPIDPLHVEVNGARLTRALSLSFLSRAPSYTFTPAKNPNRPDRSITVAVRIDPQALREITVLGPAPNLTAAASPLPIAQTGFNLGVAHGYRTFSPGTPVAGPQRDPAEVAMRYSLPSGNDARLSQRGGETSRGSHDRDGAVALAGSYRVTRNIDLTAGVRGAQDRERVKPLTDSSVDNQAVYVGTKFKF